MSNSNQYNKQKRKTLTIHFYNKDDKYVEKFQDMPGESNVKKIINLIEFYNKHQETQKDHD